MEAVVVVGHDRGLHGPRAVELAPNCLAPAGVGDGEVQAAVGYGVVPQLCRHGVCQRVGAVVQHHLGLAGRAGAEVHEHGVVRLGGHAHPELAAAAHAGVKVHPALSVRRQLAHVVRAAEVGVTRARAGGTLLAESAATAVDQDLQLQVGALVRHVVHDVRHGSLVRADDGLDGGGLQAVEHVVVAQHEGRRHHDRANLVQRHAREPELVVAAQHHQHHVALANALVGQEVCGLVRPILDVRKGEDVLLALGVGPHHGRAVGVVHGNVVHHVVGPVKVLGIVERQVGHLALLVAGLAQVVLVDVAHGFLSFFAGGGAARWPPKFPQDNRGRDPGAARPSRA